MSMPMLCPIATGIRTSATAPWRAVLPALVSPLLTLREVCADDAVSLLAMVGRDDDVSRYVSPPPSTLEGFARFITWAGRERAAGGHVCYGVVPAGMTSAVGLFQLRWNDDRFGAVQWGFVLGQPFWGCGLFEAGARLMMGFAFDVVGAVRLEAKAVVTNGRGNGALRKLGAVQEGVLRQSFFRHGRYHDQILWTLLAEDYKRPRQDPRSRVH